MTKDEIAIALSVLDEASKEMLRQSALRTDMLKENFRRDAVALNLAAQILESFPKLKIPQKIL